MHAVTKSRHLVSTSQHLVKPMQLLESGLQEQYNKAQQHHAQSLTVMQARKPILTVIEQHKPQATSNAAKTLLVFGLSIVLLALVLTGVFHQAAIIGGVLTLGFGFFLLFKQRSNSQLSHLNATWFSVATESNLDAFFIFDAIRDVHGQVQDYRCVFLNQPAKDLINQPDDTFLGRQLYQFFTCLDTPAYRHALEIVLAAGAPLDFEIETCTPYINAKWIYCKFLKMEDGLALTVSDISKIKLTEGELIQAERFQAAIIDSVSYAIIATDKHGHIITMNNAANRMLWYNEADINNHLKLEQIHDAQEIQARAEALTEETGKPVPANFEVFITKAKTGEADEREWTYVRKDGTRLPVKLSITELKDEHDQVYGYLNVAYDISEQKRQEESMRHIALHDSLSGLPNRSLFNDRARQALEQAKRNKENVAIALLDVDHFKNINDSLGHHIGDLLLQEVAQRLVGNVRVSDTIARLGGDEFAFLLPNIDNPNGIHMVMQKIVKAMRPTVDAHGHHLHVTASIGVAVYPNDGEDVATLLRKADTAMYAAKKLGRDNFQVFDAEMEAQTSNRIHMENQMRKALANDEFELFYQPLVNAQTKQIEGVEALIRWQKNPGQYISPMEFIPLAEETGLIIPIGEWVIKEACKQAKIIQQALGADVRMALNISPRQFRQKNLISHILQSIQEANILPTDIELEITENVLMADMENSVVVLGLLRALGVHVALDDFGTGYSSLSYLSRFPVDRIKIDQSFMRNVLVNKESASLTRVIVNMGKTLGIPVTAEGIETEAQLAFIQSTGCEEAQGHLVGKPMSLATLLDTYR